MFRITITEIASANSDPALPDPQVERYSQVVDLIDLPKIIQAVNSKPRRPREPKAPAARKEAK